MIVRHFFLVTEGKIFVMPSVYCVFGVLNQDNLHCKPKLCSHVLFREKKKEKKEAFSRQLFQTVHICGFFFILSEVHRPFGRTTSDRKTGSWGA